MTDGTTPPENPPENPGAGNVWGQPTPSTPPVAPVFGGATGTQNTSGVPDYTQTAPYPSKKSGRGKKLTVGLITIFGVLCLVAIGAFAYKALTGDTAGSAKPEGVITNALSSLKNQDLLGVARQGDPNEIEPFIENYKSITKAMKRNDSIKDDKKPLKDYSVEYSGIKTKTVKYSDDVARVELLDGTIKVNNNGNKDTSDISKVNEEWQNGESEDGDSIYTFHDGNDWNKNDLESQHIFYIAVKRDGRWYFSSMYTAAEYARIAANAVGADYKRPTFDVSKRVGKGASTSELATQNFLQGLFGLDIDGFIDSTAPDRFSVAYDYRNLLNDLYNTNLDNDYVKLAQDAVTITDLSTTSKKEGKTGQFVTIKGFKATIKYDAKPKDKDKHIYVYAPYAADIDVKWDGKCFTYEGTTKTYTINQNKYPTISFPITDSDGYTFTQSELEDITSFSVPQYPVTDSAGKIYPSFEAAATFLVYHPLPWTNGDGEIVYDAAGKESTQFNSLDNVMDAAGARVTDEDGEFSGEQAKATYATERSNLDDKQCYSDRDLERIPDIGLVTVKEKGKFYVSPLDSIWHYVIWAIENGYE